MPAAAGRPPRGGMLAAIRSPATEIMIKSSKEQNFAKILSKII
jgi:hypothetical protein